MARRPTGRASAALRRLVDEARRSTGDKDRVRLGQEAAYRFMAAMAGDLPGSRRRPGAVRQGSRALRAPCGAMAGRRQRLCDEARRARFGVSLAVRRRVDIKGG